MMQAATAAACEAPTGLIALLVVLSAVSILAVTAILVEKFKDYVKAIANDEIRKELEICPQCKRCRS